jgi:hypothetical protein
MHVKVIERWMQSVIHAMNTDCAVTWRDDLTNTIVNKLRDHFKSILNASREGTMS